MGRGRGLGSVEGILPPGGFGISSSREGEGLTIIRLGFPPAPFPVDPVPPLDRRGQD